MMKLTKLRKVFRAGDVEIKPGEFVAVMGPGAEN